MILPLRPVRILIIACLLLVACRSVGFATTVDGSLLDKGYNELYNVNFAGAHRSFDAYATAHPGDPMGTVSDAAAYLFSEFNRLGVLDLSLFADNSRFNDRKRPKPNLEVDRRFQARIDETRQLAANILARDPKDTSALLASVLADGLESDYEALIVGNNFASLHYSNRATVFAQRTLEVAPHCYDAYLAVGIENYLLGIKPAPVRWLLSLTGAQTNANAGIRELKLAAVKGHYLAPFAQLLLAVADLREKDYAGARLLLGGLAKEFPANPLYAREDSRIQGE